MDNGAVLDIDFVTDSYRVHIATNNGVEPETAMIAGYHVTDDGRVFGDKTRISPFRGNSIDWLNERHNGLRLFDQSFVNLCVVSIRAQHPLMTLRYFIFLFFVIAALSCKKPIEYPLEPVIGFKSIAISQDASGYDSKVFVTLTFTDGDGDLGYYPRESGRNNPLFDDPASPYYNNFIVTTYIKRSGSWVADTTNVSARLPYMTPEGANKALKGEIERELTLPPALTLDTLKYDIYIWDRALHQSNIVTTPEFVVTTR
jgi:hypothetical protein